MKSFGFENRSFGNVGGMGKNCRQSFLSFLPFVFFFLMQAYLLKVLE